MPSHPSTIFEIQKYYQNKPKFNVVYSRGNLPEIKDEAYVVNLDEYESGRNRWILLYVNGDEVSHFDSFAVEYISKEIS